MSILSSPCIPLYPITISDWLPKLGEKAFLAWVHFRSWEHQPDDQSPIELLSPLNHIIKRLKVGNSTFYNHILRPLWNHGLIELKKQPGINQFHLLVYPYPKNDPQNELEPLVPFRDYDQDFQSVESPQPVEDIPLPSHLDQAWETNGPLQDSVREEDPSSPSAWPGKDLFSPSDITHPPSLAPHIPNQNQQTDQFDSKLPLSLAIPIQSDPSLLLRQEQIEVVYMKWRDHPCYSEERFLQKIRVCVPYNQDIHRFAAYLHKALQNEWKEKPPYPAASPSLTSGSPPIPPRPRDVPEWVWMQQYGPKMEHQKCTAEQEAILDDLKRQLGILS